MQDTTPAPDTTPASQGGQPKSRTWRSLWRIHFYAGLFAFPFILLMALTGLVILYTQPLQDLSEAGKRRVTPAIESVPLNMQARGVEAEYPDATIASVVVPRNSSTSTIFHINDGTKAGRDVFVNQYSGEVLGSVKTGGGVVGLANRLHGTLNNSNIKIPLPAVSALWDDGKIMRSYVVGDLVLELLGVWTFVLVMSGLVLWWPRLATSARIQKSTAVDEDDQANEPLVARSPRRFGVRPTVTVTTRGRWRDLHAIGGVTLFSVMVLTIVSGMAWSAYWGPNFTAVANKISSNAWTGNEVSPLGTRGDLDRFGNQVPWNTQDLALPASYAPLNDSLPAPLGLDAVAQIAIDEGMRPGFQISVPNNIAKPDAAGVESITYGSFSLTNSWPRKTGEVTTVFLNQFTGEVLDRQDVYGYGSVSRTMDTLVSVHMGTQLGIVSRVAMTMLCLLSMWSVCSALMMYRRRRRPGTLGLPRRPADARLTRRLRIGAAVIGLVFPLWALSAAVILAIDRAVIQRSARLRPTFGQR
jgi:uncharacterized iron-regulated membrane protein